MARVPQGPTPTPPSCHQNYKRGCLAPPRLCLAKLFSATRKAVQTHLTTGTLKRPCLTQPTACILRARQRAERPHLGVQKLRSALSTKIAHWQACRPPAAIYICLQGEGMCWKEPQPKRSVTGKAPAPGTTEPEDRRAKQEDRGAFLNGSIRPGLRRHPWPPQLGQLPPHSLGAKNQ